MGEKDRLLQSQWLQIVCRDGSDHQPNGRGCDAYSDMHERRKHLDSAGTLCGPHRVVRRTVIDEEWAEEHAEDDEATP